jgi:hypothetical protein
MLSPCIFALEAMKQNIETRYNETTGFIVMQKCLPTLVLASAMLYLSANSYIANATTVSNSVIEAQREALEKNTDGKGFGPQSPRDIDQIYGTNKHIFGFAPNRSQMNLCNIHFHRNAEHKGGEYTTYAGNGDGLGNHTGFVFDGKLSSAQLSPVKGNVCGEEEHSLLPGDTIEVHYVYSSAEVLPGESLGSCLDENTTNPDLRVEAQVFVLANDSDALDFKSLTEVERMNGYIQAPNIPTSTGKPVQYIGSTTGPTFDEKASPIQVTWNVRPKVATVNIDSVGKWCKSNEFNEHHAHGVRNLVTNPKLLSNIER